ncbi:MerR family transcriptional regulator [Paenibacillus sp. NEAU-GSW1]|uniref:MerR family transcriptional regulator n=1 Tax=Paenibacillus sp. NEAU-GSW1 TaxID=2682486 RepID=UPI00346478D0
MASGGYLRGQLAKLANVNIETLRYYEELGILSAPLRSESGYRLYSEEALERLAFIHNAKRCGFTLKEIQKALLKPNSQPITIDDFIVVIEKKQNKIRSEMAKKEMMLDMLEYLKKDLQQSDMQPATRAILQMMKMES